VLAGIAGALGATVGLALEQEDLASRLRKEVQASNAAAMGLVAQMSKMRGTILKQRLVEAGILQEVCAAAFNTPLGSDPRTQVQRTTAFTALSGLLELPEGREAFWRMALGGALAEGVAREHEGGLLLEGSETLPPHSAVGVGVNSALQCEDLVQSLATAAMAAPEGSPGAVAVTAGLKEVGFVPFMCIYSNNW